MQVAQRGGVGDTQKLSGPGPGSPAVADPASAFGVGPADLQGCLPSSAIL